MPILATELALTTVSGPKPVTLDLVPPQPRTIGRLPSNSLVLDDPQVTRVHAEITYREDFGGGGVWSIQDLHSRHGVRINGNALTPGKPCPLREGDIIEVRPWILRVVNPAQPRDPGSIAHTVVDGADGGGLSTMALPVDAVRDLDRHRLRLVLQCAEEMQSAGNAQKLAEVTLDAAVRGTGFANAALLGPLENDGSITILGRTGAIDEGEHSGARPALSRTLIQQASRGQPVQLMNRSGPLNHSHSVIQLGIQEAICVPLMIESTVAGYIYLDTRGRRGHASVAHDAGAFVTGLGRMAALALANLARQDLEKRYAHIEGEIAAAGAAQKLILPSRTGSFSGVRYIGECRAGRTVSGDFFDVFALPDGRTAITIGDVAGKGVPASVLMTTTQGFLHGALFQHGDAARAANDLNAFVNQRGDGGRFVTLWIGVLDVANSTLSYVNAGHGYAWLVSASGEVKSLEENGGPPIGVAADRMYRAASTSVPAGGCIAAVSDGIIEQPLGGGADDIRAEQFSRKRVETFLSKSLLSDDAVAELFAAVSTHGSAKELADDATVLIVKW